MQEWRISSQRAIIRQVASHSNINSLKLQSKIYFPRAWCFHNQVLNLLKRILTSQSWLILSPNLLFKKDQQNSFTNTILMRMGPYSSWVLSERKDYGKTHTKSDKFKLSHHLLGQGQLTCSWAESLLTAELRMNHSLTLVLISGMEDKYFQPVTLLETAIRPLMSFWTGT